MYRIGIMEDCLESTGKLERWFREYGEKKQLILDIRRWKQEGELMADIEKGLVPDVVFLSVGSEWECELKEEKKISWWMKPDGRTRQAQLSSFGKKEDPLKEINRSGIALGRKLRDIEACKSLQLIYVSNEEMLYEGLIRTRPLDYLVEPVSQKKALTALKSALDIVKDQNERFTFSFQNDFYFLPMRDILYISINGRRLTVKALEGDFEFNGKMKEVVKMVPEEFLPIHRSYVINKNYVQRYDYECVQMRDGQIFTISEPNRKMVRRVLLDR